VKVIRQGKMRTTRRLRSVLVVCQRWALLLLLAVVAVGGIGVVIESRLPAPGKALCILSMLAVGLYAVRSVSKVAELEAEWTAEDDRAPMKAALSSDWFERAWAADNLADSEHETLARMAEEDVDARVRRRAVARLRESGVLERVAASDKSWRVRRLAAARLTKLAAPEQGRR
jgi:hypothetical protein